ncbi:MAG TPA: hypothetical protein VGM03_06490 [Phycisphaerae bacterium]
MNGRMKRWLLALAAAGMPLATVATCNFDGSTGSFFLDRGHRFDDEFFVDDEVFVVDEGVDFIDDCCCCF